ncbi:MAG: hypothetical protein VYC71_08090, partial [Planctomycetota bacterium]|nr:hypothetical protein [Planctomycetota bacterium]
ETSDSSVSSHYHSCPRRGATDAQWLEILGGYGEPQRMLWRIRAQFGVAKAICMTTPRSHFLLSIVLACRVSRCEACH